MPDWLGLVLLLGVAAFLAGVMNTIAGGGTLLTFPSLLTITEETVANTTSTVALLPGSLAGVWGYRRELRENRRWIALLFWPSLVGGVTGALLLTQLDKAVFKALVPWLILLAAVLFLVQPLLSRWFPPHPEGEISARGALGLIVFQFAVAIYGGYFGAGIGILMLSSLGLMGVGDIRHMNAIKNLLAAIINGIAALVFGLTGTVLWGVALLMMASSVAGGLSGAWLGRSLPKPLVRGIVVVIGFSVAGWQFYRKLNGE